LKLSNFNFINPESSGIFFSINTSSNDELSPYLTIRKSRGTLGNPTVVQPQDILGGIAFNAYTGDTYDTSALLYSVVEEVTSGVVSPSLRLKIRRPFGSDGPPIPELININSGSVIVYSWTDTVNPIQLINSHNSPNNSANFVLSRSRGTPDNPEAVQNGDVVFKQVFRAHDGTAFRLNCQIRASVDGPVSPNIVPGRLDITLVNTSGVNTNILRLTNDKVVHADKLGSLDNSYIEFMQIPKLPTFANETAADAAIGGAGNRQNGMMYYDSGVPAIKSVVNGSWTIL
jgi:hypothetical protein